MTTNTVTGTIKPFQGIIYEIEVNETYGKLYVSSESENYNGIISVIDIETKQIIKQFMLPTGRSILFINMENDEVHDKVYFTHYNSMGVIDAATDIYTEIPQADYPYLTNSPLAINCTTNEIYIPFQQGTTRRLNIIDGNTLNVELVDFPKLSAGAMWTTVNENNNKVYMAVLKRPDNGMMGICIFNRNNQTFFFTGMEDLEPLVFNNESNMLFFLECRSDLKPVL